MVEEERDALRRSCRWLVGHGYRTPAWLLAETAAWCEANEVAFDAYGEGALIEEFEQRVADLLGFEAGRFMPSGTMAQLIALRVWCGRAGNNHVGMHPTSHLELHEQGAYAHLHGLRSTLVGPHRAPMEAEHFEAVAEPLAVLLTELPVREAGGVLPSWEELTALKEAVAATGTRLHLDGARLWECAPFYQRSYAEICAGFDSAYVSFYKGIGALAGAMLVGSRDLIDEAGVWQRRGGGNLFSLTPNVASAAMQFDDRLARMATYRDRAVEVAAALSEVDGIRVVPDPPQVSMMHVLVDGEFETVEQLLERRDRFARSSGLWLFGGASPTDVPGTFRIELTINEAALELADDEIVDGFRSVVAGSSA